MLVFYISFTLQPACTKQYIPRYYNKTDLRLTVTVPRGTGNVTCALLSSAIVLCGVLTFSGVRANQGN